MKLARVLIWSVLTVFNSALAQPQSDVRIQHYLVGGNSSAEIRADLKRLGPVGENGRRFHASTQWNIQWSYRWVESSGRCLLNRAEVSVGVDMLLPKLRPAERDVELQQNWERYLAALTEHEEQHRDYGLAAARELEQELNTLRDWMDCARLEQTTNQRAQQVLDRYSALEREFDRRTDHGARQGVILP